MKRTLFALAVLAAALPATAAPGPNDLIVTAGAARYSLSSGHSQLLMLDDGSRAIVTAALKLDDPAYAALWGRLLTGATQLRHENGDQADTLWFNPLFDGGVVAHWTRVNGTWQVQAVSPVTGAALRSEAGLIEPHRMAWLNTPGDMGRNLGISAEATFAAADRADWAALAGVKGNVDAVLMRPYEANRGLFSMVATPGYEHALNLVDHLMITGDPAALRLPVAMRRGLASYGDSARDTLGPVAAYRRPDGWTLVMQSPEAPQVAWLIHFAAPRGDDPAMPRGFVAVGTGPATRETAQ